MTPFARPDAPRRRLALGLPLALGLAALVSAPGALPPVLGPALAGPLAPEDGGDPELSPQEQYAARRQAVMEEIAGRLADTAKFAMRKKLKATGLKIFERVLDFDTDHKDARRELGFDNKKGAWEANEYKQGKIAEYEDEGYKYQSDLDEKLADTEKRAAQLLAELGKLANDTGSYEDADVHWKMALRFDSQNDLANESVGNKKVDGRWYTEQGLAHKDFKKAYESALAKARALEVPVVASSENTGIKDECGVPLKVLSTTNFRIESTLPRSEIEDTLRWLERARVFYIELYEIPERLLAYENNKPTSVIVARKEYDQICDKSSMVPEDKRSWAKKFGGYPMGERVYLSVAQNGETAQRSTIHHQMHTMARDTVGDHMPWLKEALANSVAGALKGADLSVCFSGDGSTAGIHLDRIQLETAPEVLFELASHDLKEKNPQKKKLTPMEGLVKLPSDGLAAKDIAKAWSVLMFLLEKDRERTREYLGAASGGNGENSKNAGILARFFSDYKSWRTLENDWMEWVLDVYKP